MADSQPEEIKRKEYKKPQVTEVKLVAEEAVLGNCKNNNGVQASCAPDLACLASPRS